MIKQEDMDPRDQASETSTYHNSEIIQQREEGLLTRWEADFNDILATHNVVFSNDSFSSRSKTISDGEQTCYIMLYQIYIQCQWNDIPLLRQWIMQFLASRQPDAIIIASGMAKRGISKIAMDQQNSIEGYLLIGSTEQELHGTVAENMSEHLTAEKQIRGYAIYSTPIIL